MQTKIETRKVHVIKKNIKTLTIITTNDDSCSFRSILLTNDASMRLLKSPHYF